MVPYYFFADFLGIETLSINVNRTFDGTSANKSFFELKSGFNQQEVSTKNTVDVYLWFKVSTWEQFSLEVQWNPAEMYLKMIFFTVINIHISEVIKFVYNNESLFSNTTPDQKATTKLLKRNILMCLRSEKEVKEAGK